MYSPDAVIDALELVEALNKRFKKYTFKSFDKKQHWKETDSHSSEILMNDGDSYIYLAELTNYDNCFPYLQYNGVRYVGIEKMLNIYRRAYVMRPLIEAGTVLTKNYECMLAALNKLYQKNKIIGTRGKFRIVTSQCTGREMSKIVGNLRLKSIKKEEQLRDTKYIVDSPKKGMLTKINPLPKEKLELPYYPVHQKLKKYYRKESSVKTKKNGKTVTKKKSKLVKLLKTFNCLIILDSLFYHLLCWFNNNWC